MTPPSTIGRYQIQQVLGHGAMGVVYLATDPILHRPVAIKAMREPNQGGDDQEVTRERFRREAEISARLNHPNIVTVFDVGDDPQAGPFMAMEYVNGRSLAQLIRDGLGLEAGVHLLLQGMGAVTTAAEAGITHRDIKPENILVSSDGRFKLMDFGIARRGESRLTQAGMVFGTPSYTAPELLVGGEATPASDRYAFAVTAFEVVTGTVPYQGSSIGTMLYKIVHEPPIMPEGMDPALQRLFARAFAKKPEDRHPDLRSFMAELVAALPLPEEARARFLSQLEEERGLETRVYPPSMLALSQGLPHPERNSGPMAPPPGTGPQAAVPATGARLLLPAALGVLLVLGAAGGGLWFWVQPRAIDIQSDPAGAQVSLDGQALGLTPMERVPVKRQAAALTFTLRGHLPRTVPVPKVKDYVRVELEREPFEIAVVTDPPGAEVVVAGKVVGVTPMKGLRLPWKDTPRVVLRLQGHQEHAVVPDRDTWSDDPIRLSPLTRSK